MQKLDDLKGASARLPDGQLVRIEKVYADGYATVRRMEGRMKGMVALCSVSKLEEIPPTEENGHRDPD